MNSIESAATSLNDIFDNSQICIKLKTAASTRMERERQPMQSTVHQKVNIASCRCEPLGVNQTERPVLRHCAERWKQELHIQKPVPLLLIELAQPVPFH